MKLTHHELGRKLDKEESHNDHWMTSLHRALPKPDRVAHQLGHEHPIHQIPSKFQKAIQRYTGGSDDLNRALYDAHVDKTSTGNIIRGHNLEHLDGATTHHTLTKPLTVYSGVTSRVPNDAAKHPKRIVEHPSFISTSIRPSTAHNFTKDDENNHHMLRIHLKAGHKMLPVLSHSEFPEEHEVILPRGHSFKISKDPEVHEYWSHSGKDKKLHIWDAHIHDPNKPNEPKKQPLWKRLFSKKAD